MNDSKGAQRVGKVVVIGAGIAGLSAAHYLKKRGVDVEIIEREKFFGGAVRSALKDDRYLIELGPNAFLANAEPVTKLARDLSIEPLIVGSDELSKNRYIYRGGRLHKLPMNPFAFLGSRLISTAGKLRAMFEPFVRSKSKDDETLAQFVERRAGKEILEALVDPFASGVWAGDPRQLEMKSVLPKFVEIERECGSVMKGMKKLKREGETNTERKKGLYSFRWGLGTLTARLEEELRGKLKLGAAALSIEKGRDGGFKVRVEGQVLPILADAVVIATPAPQTAGILAALSSEIVEPLSSIPYSPLAVVHTAFKTTDIPKKLDGFGVLIPRGEGIRLLGSIWASAIFPGRCPKDEELLTNYIGGATDAGLIDLSDEDITKEVLDGLKKTMGITASPKFIYVKRVAQAIPQYNLGHAKNIGIIQNELEKIPGVFLTGSYFDGVSVSDTIANARSEVDRVFSYLKRTVVFVKKD